MTDKERLEQLIADQAALQRHAHGNQYFLEKIQILGREITELRQKLRLFDVDWEVVNRCRRFTDKDSVALVRAIDTLKAAEEARYTDFVSADAKLYGIAQSLAPLRDAEEWPEVPANADLLKVGIPALFTALKRCKKRLAAFERSASDEL